MGRPGSNNIAGSGRNASTALMLISGKFRKDRMMNRQSDVTLPAKAPEFILTRAFNAPRPLVYKSWMEPSHISQWWGPRGFTCSLCEVDARVGGIFRLVIRAPDGTDYPMRGTFCHIVPN